MQKFDTPAPVSAVLDVPAGRIRLIAADRADTTVEVLPADAARSRDVRAAERIDVRYDDGVLRITAPGAKNRMLGNSGAVEVTVQLPAGSHLAGKASAGELRGVGRLGDVAFEAAQGQVKLDETAGARLTLLAGDITVGAARGVSATLDAGTAHGRIHNALSNTDGAAAGLTIHATTSQGDITARSL
ncbi:DUF4097 family beta strand repeat-containing protein [Streptomyces sp. NPDC059696]|uniref:DUF4097 family beta strand repeat-containing protein n=1 Tax=Streptomyces sp. NPDC059696 TaxID=3346911 RepID=UPI00367680C1